MPGCRITLLSLLCTAPIWAQTVVTITPTTADIHVGTSLQFTSKVTGATNTAVTWTVALPTGATGTPGTISTGGRYTPPAVLPVPNQVIVTATSVENVAASASATLNLLNPFPTVASTLPSTVPTGSYTIAVNGSGFVTGAVVKVNGVALPTTYVSATKLTATGSAANNQSGKYLPVDVTNPAPGPTTSVESVTLRVGTEKGNNKVTEAAARRFLLQAGFGGDADSVAHVQKMGFDAYINEQFTLAASPYQDPATLSTSNGPVQSRFFSNAVHGRDQLRQRVALALHEIFVISGIEESAPWQMVPYLRVLQGGAFGNFRQLMYDVTVNVAMGEYLDMRNNSKANPTTGTLANENYSRELLQLFTIGLVQLNADGSVKKDGNGNPIPTYDQAAVQEFAKVYTGWTYPTKPGATLAKFNPSYYEGPMVPYELNHDTTAKALLNGTVIPAGGTANGDLNAALDNIFNHANVGPFIGKQLIQHLVTSNPSPAYVSRITAVFNNNGAGVRGDLKAVVKAILLDSEARAGDSGPGGGTPTASANGHLMEPVLALTAILRGLGTQVNDTNSVNTYSARLGQNIFSPPSVFSYFAPGYQVPASLTPGSTWSGPEFQNVSPDGAVNWYNTINTLVYSTTFGGMTLDLTPYINLGNDPQGLVNLVNKTFYQGWMSGQMQTEIIAALNAITGTTSTSQKARAQAALYLALSSANYRVAH